MAEPITATPEVGLAGRLFDRQSLDILLADNTLLDYTTAAVVLVVGVLAVKIANSVVFGIIERWSSQSQFAFFQLLGRLLRKTLVPLLYFGVFYLALSGLSLPQPLSQALRVAGIVLFTMLAVLFAQNLAQYLLVGIWLRGVPEEERRRTVGGLLPALKVFLWGLGAVFLLDNLGFQITAVITGLGIGGIAIGLAAQAVLGDLFSYYSILLDRPFEIGDFIIVGDFMGTVEHVGIKTTRIRSLSGEQLVFSNSDLTGSRVKNYKRMQRRRIVFQVGVTYSSSVEQLQAGVEAIRAIFAEIPEATLDRAHFFRFGAFSLDYEVVYFVESANYNVYMDVQQRINLALKERFEGIGLSFAFPTQTLHLVREG